MVRSLATWCFHTPEAAKLGRDDRSAVGHAGMVQVAVYNAEYLLSLRARMSR
jgi:hypothetical protein